MTAALHHLGSELINKYQQVAGKDIFNAIENASRTTGVDFGYLLEQAQAESNFDADVKAKTSSATGLFQFIENTWLETVAKHGYKHGLGKYGQEISFDPKRGKISVSSPIGEGLLGKAVGEVAQIKTPRGMMEFEILDISIK